MSNYQKIGGLFAPLLFYFLFPNILINAETVEIFISARNSLNNAGLSIKNDLLSATTDKRVVVEFIGLSFSRFYYKYGSMIDSFNINIDDAGSPEVLRAFLINADRYADGTKNLIIWDHGNGWYNTIGTFAISYDGKTGHSIGIANGEFRNVFNFCYSNYGIRYKTILLDACLMGEIEIAREIEEYTDYLIASPNIVPINSLNYKTLLSNNDYFDNIKNVIHDFNNTGKVKYSIIRLCGIDNFLNELKDNISKFQGKSMSDIVKNIHYYPDKMPNDSIQCSLRDLIEVCDDSRLKDAFGSLLANNYDSTDVSIFFPSDIRFYINRIYEYRNTIFNNSIRWDSVVFSLYGEVDSFPPIASFNSSIIIEKNKVAIGMSDFYDFYSDIYLDIYNLNNYSVTMFYDFENNNLPISDGWMRSMGESYSGNYSYYTSGGSIKFNSYMKPIYLSFYYYAYNPDFKILLFKNSMIKETQLPKMLNAKWQYFVLCDTEPVDSAELVVDSNNGWVFLDNLEYGTFSSQYFMGRKEAGTDIDIYNLKRGTYDVYCVPVDFYGNRGIPSKIFDFAIENRAKAYIWPVNGEAGKLRHISIDDTEDLTQFLVFTVDGRKIEINMNLNDRTFTMPVNAKYGIYYFLARTNQSLYKGEFAITR